MQMTEANWINNDGSGIKIAIIDSGVDCNHDCFKNYKFKGFSIENDEKGFVVNDSFIDNIYYGTAIASIINCVIFIFGLRGCLAFFAILFAPC